jgi:hypothetical protein
MVSSFLFVQSDKIDEKIIVSGNFMVSIDTAFVQPIDLFFAIVGESGMPSGTMVFQ